MIKLVVGANIVFGENTKLTPVAKKAMALFLENAIQEGVISDSVLATGVRGTVTYTLEDGYTWIVMATDGSYTATSTVLTSGRFKPDVTVNDNYGETVFSEKFVISVYYDNTLVYEKNDTTLVLAPTDKGEMVKTANGYTSLRVPAAIDSTYWHWIIFYKEAYATTGLDTAVIDQTDSNPITAVSVINEPTIAYGFNNIRAVRSDEGNLYVDAFDSSTSKRVITVYSPAGDAGLSYTAKNIYHNQVTVGVNFGGEESQVNVHPYSREILINGNNGGYTHVGAIDTSDNSFRYIKQTGQSGDGVKALAVAGDETYVYSVSGRSPISNLHRTAYDPVTHAIGATSVIASTTNQYGDIDLVQRRGGVYAEFRGVSGYVDGNYWLYEGAITLVVDLENGQPWPDYDGYGDTIGSEYPALGAYSSCLIGDVPTNGDTSATVTTATVPTIYDYNVTTYVYRLFNTITATDSSIIAAAYDYAGIAHIDTKDFSKKDLDSHVSRIRMLCHSNGKIYYGGYPSQGIYEYDPINKTDPVFLGYAGGEESASKGHYIQGMAEGSDGLVYITGVQYRVGDSGTVAWFDPDDFAGTISGFTDIVAATPPGDADLLDYGFNNCVAIGDKIIVSTHQPSGSGATTSKIFVLDTSTKAFTAKYALDASLTTTGWIVAVNDTEIVGATTTDGSDAIIYKMNITTGTVVYQYSYTNMRTDFIIDTFQTKMFNIELGTDGYVYYVSYSGESKYLLIRVEPSTGGVEFMGTMSNDAFTIMPNGDLYIVGNADGHLYQKLGMFNIDNMPPVEWVLGAEMMTYPNFSGDEFADGTDWTIDTGIGTWTFNDIGGSDHLNSASLLTKGDTYEIALGMDSITGASELRLKVGSLDNLYFPVGTNTFTITLDEASTTTNMAFLVGAATNIVLSSFSVKLLTNIHA